MLKSITGSSKIAYTIGGAIATAATIAGLIVALTSATPQASAAAAVELAKPQAPAKADRIPNRVTGSACSSLSWPHYEQSCQFDLRGPARTVRIIALR